MYFYYILINKYNDYNFYKKNINQTYYTIQDDTQPSEGHFIQNSLKTGPYTLLDKGTTCFDTITILFSLNLINTPQIRLQFDFALITKAL